MNPWFDDVQTAYWLIDYTLRSSALLVLAAAAALLWRRSSAAVRHRIWSLGLVGALVLPLAGSIAPPLALPWWLRPEPPAPGRADIGEVHPLADQAALDRGPRAYADPPIAANDVPADRALDPAGPARAPATVAAVARRKAISMLGHPSAAIVLAAVWFAGAVVAAIPLAVGAMQSWRFVHGGREEDDPCWLALFDELTAQLGFRRRVRLIVDERVAVPLAAGVLWPVIVLPNAHAWDASLRRNVLLHELAHVRRWDVGWQLLGRAACVALWHHPLAWLALRAMRAERELACDDFALSAGARASDYAGHLLSVALEAGRRPAAWALAMAQDSDLEQRVRAVLDANRRRGPVSRRAAAALAAFAALATLSIAALQPAAAREDNGLEPSGAQPAATATGNETVAPHSEATGAGAEQAEADRLRAAAGDAGWESTSRAAAATAEDLLAAVAAAETWIEEVDSFLVRLKTTQRRTDEGMKPRVLKMPFMSDTGPVAPSRRVTLIESTLAWDRRRVLAEYRVDERSLDRRTFQGSLAIEEHRLTESSGETRQSFVVDDKPDLIFQQVFEHTWSSWGRATRFFGPRPWWRSLHESEPAEVVLPPRLVLSGPEPYRGHDCYRVESPWGRRYFVRAGDRRLAGQQHVSFAGGPAAELALKGQAAGRAFATFPEWAAWLASLDESRRDQVEQREEALRRERSLVVFERCYDDYREIAAGCWLPFAQLARSFDVDSGKSIVRAESATEIAELSVNQPLPDAVFAHEIPEGAVVSTDWRYQVPIHYSYSTAQTEGDRQRLAAQQAAARDESQNIFDGIKSAIDLRLGQAPPELPREGWIGSRPLDWQGLRGKAVALVFWDIGCGPCHGTLDLLETSAKNAALYGQAVVAVHRATDDRSAVENELAKRGWTMPVVIDGDGKSAAQASLFEALGIEAMPWVVVVDRQGRVAAHDHGSLGSTIFRHFGELSK